MINIFTPPQVPLDAQAVAQSHNLSDESGFEAMLQAEVPAGNYPIDTLDDVKAEIEAEGSIASLASNEKTETDILIEKVMQGLGKDDPVPDSEASEMEMDAGQDSDTEISLILTGTTDGVAKPEGSALEIAEDTRLAQAVSDDENAANTQTVAVLSDAEDQNPENITGHGLGDGLDHESISQVADGQSQDTPPGGAALSDDNSADVHGLTTTQQRPEVAVAPVKAPRASDHQVASRNAAVADNLPKAIGHLAAKAAAGKSGAAEVSDTVMLQAQAASRGDGVSPTVDAGAHAKAAEQSFLDMVDRMNAPIEKQPEQVFKAPRPMPVFKSPLASNIAAQIQSHNVEDGKVTIRLRPQGMGIIEIEIAKQLNGMNNVTLRVQNPLVLEALRAEQSSVAEIWSDQGSLDLEMFSHDDGQKRQPEKFGAKGTLISELEEPEFNEEIHDTRSGIVI